MAGGKALPAEVLDQIVSRADGVPLFLEELTKTVLEGDLLELRNGQYVLSKPLPPLAIPTSLHSSLMARLDRRCDRTRVLLRAAPRRRLDGRSRTK